MDDVYQNINDYNPNRERKILVVFDDKIADIMTNKKFQAIIKELFIRSRKVNIVFITQQKQKSQNQQQKRITKYCNKSFCRYRFCEVLQRMHKKTVFFFDN